MLTSNDRVVPKWQNLGMECRRFRLVFIGSTGLSQTLVGRAPRRQLNELRDTSGTHSETLVGRASRRWLDSLQDLFGRAPRRYLDAPRDASRQVGYVYPSTGQTVWEPVSPPRLADLPH